MIFSFMLLASMLYACAAPTSTNPIPVPSTTLQTQTPASPPPTATEPAAPASAEVPSPTSAPLVETGAPEAGSTRIIEIDQMQQVYVPAGEFIIGAEDEDAKTTIEGGVAYPENPEHTFYLDGYWIDKYEVSNGQYELCVQAGVCEPPWSPGSSTRARYYGEPEFLEYPVIWVTWYKAQTYCEWADRRLPTEAEWEKAARGTDGRKYPWGEERVNEDLANYCDRDCPRTYADGFNNDGYPDTAPVGSFPAGASPYGALDMAGNVWEWNSTLIRPYPYDPDDGREDLSATGERGWRGGPWSNGWWWMRSSLRYHSVPHYQWFNLGFRCASSE